MVLASGLRSGHVVVLDKQRWKVVESVVHSGGGRMGSMVHAKLRNLSTGSFTERRFAPDNKIETLDVDRVKMEYLYSEKGALTFMNPQTYDQVPILAGVIGPAAKFLKEGDSIEVEFYEGNPISAYYPSIVEVKVAATGAGIRGQTDSTFKDATLENGLQILVPQFIKEGDKIKVEVETGKYLERLTK